ncbi:hypothetical protein HR12_34315 [Microbacterium sp. SUBG005]|nr:hypothetical protein HR12_34315 [Microbacterium sp. SUBG005]
MRSRSGFPITRSTTASPTRPSTSSPQDDPEHTDSGIVAVHLNHGPASIYLNVDCERTWTATLTERSGEFPLTGGHLIALGEELLTTGRLCEYLQRRTDAAAAGEVASS